MEFNKTVSEYMKEAMDMSKRSDDFGAVPAPEPKPESKPKSESKPEPKPEPKGNWVNYTIEKL